jgi:Zn-dependent protease
MSAIQLNLQLAVFNMLPIPPLDGHRVLGYFLPRNLRDAYYRITPGIGLMILLVLMWVGILGQITVAILIPLGEWWGVMLPEGGNLFGFQSLFSRQ